MKEGVGGWGRGGASEELASCTSPRRAGTSSHLPCPPALPACLLACRECGYEVVEMNASDTRNKSDAKVGARAHAMVGLCGCGCTGWVAAEYCVPCPCWSLEGAAAAAERRPAFSPCLCGYAPQVSAGIGGKLSNVIKVRGARGGPIRSFVEGRFLGLDWGSIALPPPHTY